MNHQKKDRKNTRDKVYDRAVVVGSGVPGLTAARVLASSTLDKLECLFPTLNDTGWDILVVGERWGRHSAL